jgi:hypothetical protein
VHELQSCRIKLSVVGMVVWNEMLQELCLVHRALTEAVFFSKLKTIFNEPEHGALQSSPLEEALHKFWNE